MNKRGQSERAVSFTIELVIAIAVCIAFIIFASKAGRNEDVKREFLVEDAALLVDSFHSVPGNVSFNYRTINYTEDLKLNLIRNYIELKQPFGSTIAAAFRQGSLNLFENEVDIQKNKMNILVFSKSQSDISLTKVNNE